MTIGQETRWAYSTTLPIPRGAYRFKISEGTSEGIRKTMYGGEDL